MDQRSPTSDYSSRQTVADHRHSAGIPFGLVSPTHRGDERIDAGVRSRGRRSLALSFTDGLLDRSIPAPGVDGIGFPADFAFA